MKRYIAAVVMMVLSLQCTKQDPKTHIILESAAKCMEHHPDSSLAILNTLKLDSLPTQKERARYALLKSIALDKNYIDVTSDSLTSIALAYYKKHGTPDDCCCLYCIGLNGSEISNYLNIKYFYKNSSVIRKKLGIQSVNIDTFLLNKMKEMS